MKKQHAELNESIAMGRRSEADGRKQAQLFKERDAWREALDKSIEETLASIHRTFDRMDAKAAQRSATRDNVNQVATPL